MIIHMELQTEKQIQKRIFPFTDEKLWELAEIAEAFSLWGGGGVRTVSDLGAPTCSAISILHSFRNIF